MKNRTAFAIAAHPDDIEFKMAGTLLRLRQAGWEIHYLNVANGGCGSDRLRAPALKRRRAAEAKHAAKILGAHFHPSLCNDLEILYDLKLLRRLAALVRAVRPAILLTHPPVDYMEDHVNTCRLAVTAAFSRGMPNFQTLPARPAVSGDVTVYHCLPHGLCDPLRRPVRPEFFVDTTAVQETMRAAQLAHRSQHAWLAASQGMGSVVESMDADSRAVGRLSKKFTHAEGWWRHLHHGFGTPDADPLREALGMRPARGTSR